MSIPIKSTFAILDVKTGRGMLRTALKKGKRVSVVIRGEISGEWSDSDGISQEFGIEVNSVETP